MGARVFVGSRDKLVTLRHTSLERSGLGRRYSGSE